MDWVLAILLFTHVAGAIVAFGPTFSFPFLGSMAGSEPQHRNFALRYQQRVATRLVVPLAVLQGVTGLLLVWRIGFDILSRGWLLVAIVLYLTALAISFGIMLPALRTLIPATSGPPPTPPAGSAPAGPPPHLAAIARRARMAGFVNMALILTIVFLMVTKPF
jgi:uncharacterized membrane protein